MKNRKAESIDKALKAHYSSKSLSENQLDELMSMQRNAFEAQTFEEVNESEVKTGLELESDRKAGWWHRLIPDTQSYRYAFYLVTFMFIGCLFTVYKLLDQAPLTQRVMTEIVYNHKQDMPIEVATDSLTDIAKYLNKLSFSIILPSAFEKPNWKFLGGRYCSINGKLAAQLKIKNLKDNKTYTFYQAAVDTDLKKSNEDSMSDIIDGVDVSIWHEKGLLLGLAIDNKALAK